MYFCCIEARGRRPTRTCHWPWSAHDLVIEVTRVSAGADATSRPIEDRVEALGGTLELADDAARPGDVRLPVRLPVAGDPDGQRPAAAAAHSWTSRSGPNAALAT